MTEPIPYLSVCSGIEAFSVAVEGLGFVPRAFSEIEDFPSQVLRYWWPDVPNLGDMTAIDTDSLGPVGWLVGGTPCQSFSVAGLRQSLSDERGNLTLEYVRIAHALAEKNGLRGALWENVPGCLTTKDNAFGCFLGALIGADGPLLPGDKPADGRSTATWQWIAPRERVPVVDDEGEETGEFTEAIEGYHRARWPSQGMAAGPRARLAWRVLNSQHFGVPQRRRRVYVVIDFGNGPDPAAVLFEPRGKGRRAAASRQAREELAGTLGGSSQDGGFRTTDLDNNGAFVVAHALTGEGHDASEDGTGRGTPLVVDTETALRDGDDSPDVVGALDAHAGKGRGLNGQDAYQGKLIPVEYLGNAEGQLRDVPSLNASNGAKGINNQTPLIAVIHSDAIGRDGMAQNPSTDAAGVDRARDAGMGVSEEDASYNLMAHGRPHAVAVFDPNQITNPDNRSQPAEELAHSLPAQAQPPVLFGIAPSANSDGSPPTARADGEVIVFNSKDHGQDAGEVSPSLRAAGSRDGRPNGGAPPAIAFLSSGNTEGAAEELSPSLRTSMPNAVAFNMRGREGGNMPELGGDQASALRGADGGSSAPMVDAEGGRPSQTLRGPQVRRLTPTECERLQGYQDGHTLIPGLSGWRAVGDDEDLNELRAAGLEVRTSKSGKSRVNDPDGPRYKALGNSFTVEVINWIMSRAKASMDGRDMPDWQPLGLWRRGRKRRL